MNRRAELEYQSDQHRTIGRAELDSALRHQTEQIEKLFDAKLKPLIVAQENLELCSDDHEERLRKTERALTVTRVKLGLLFAGIVSIASTVAAFVTRHFMSVVVTK